MNESPAAQSVVRSLAGATGRSPEEIEEFVDTVMKFNQEQE